MSTSEDCFHLGIKALIQNNRGEVLLLKVNVKKLSGPKDAYWDIPGGRVQRNSSVEQTLKREVEEEIGVASIKNINPVAMVLSNIRIPVKPVDVGLILAIYSCDIEPNATIRLSDEHVDFGWFSGHEAAELLAVKYPKEFTEKLELM